MPAWVGGHAVSAGSGGARPGCLSSQAGTLGKDLAGWLEASAGPGLWKRTQKGPVCLALGCSFQTRASCVFGKSIKYPKAATDSPCDLR